VKLHIGKSILSLKCYFKYILKVMRTFKQIGLLILLLCGIGSCTKKPTTITTPNEPKQPEDAIVLEIVSEDTLRMPYDSVFYLDVRVNSSLDKEVVMIINNTDPCISFTEYTVKFDSHASGKFTLKFNQFNVTPGVYYIDLLVNFSDYTAGAKATKRIYFIYQPTCAYSYTSYQNANIFYINTQEQENKSVWCSYTEGGLLEVGGLTPHIMEWKIDCNTRKITLKPTTYEGNYVTGSGTITNGVLDYRLYHGATAVSYGQIMP
jgi:hypothetical protein